MDVRKRKIHALKQEISLYEKELHNALIDFGLEMAIQMDLRTDQSELESYKEYKSVKNEVRQLKAELETFKALEIRMAELQSALDSAENTMRSTGKKIESILKESFEQTQDKKSFIAQLPLQEEREIFMQYAFVTATKNQIIREASALIAKENIFSLGKKFLEKTNTYFQDKKNEKEIRTLFQESLSKLVPFIIDAVKASAQDSFLNALFSSDALQEILFLSSTYEEAHGHKNWKLLEYKAVEDDYNSLLMSDGTLSKKNKIKNQLQKLESEEAKVLKKLASECMTLFRDTESAGQITKLESLIGSLTQERERLCLSDTRDDLALKAHALKRRIHELSQGNKGFLERDSIAKELRETEKEYAKIDELLRMHSNEDLSKAKDV